MVGLSNAQKANTEFEINLPYLISVIMEFKKFNEHFEQNIKIFMVFFLLFFHNVPLQRKLTNNKAINKLISTSISKHARIIEYIFFKTFFRRKIPTFYIWTIITIIISEKTHT